MKKTIYLLSLLILFSLKFFGQCNAGLNLGTVVVPTHGNASNGGNFTVAAMWQQASAYIDTLNLDFRQRYITWKDVVNQITGNVPTFSFNSTFENNLSTWAGNPSVHIVYPIIKVGVPNTLDNFPTGAATFTTFLDTGYISQNYKAIRHVLSNVNNVKWISIGNEIETYFGSSFLNDGQLTKYAQFLSIMKTKINTDFPTVKVGTILAFHTMNFNSELNMIDSVINNVDYIGYTFYYTTTASSNCWDSPTTVKNWLNLAKTKSGSKKMFLTETCMGDGGGTGQNCGAPSKQLAYADTLLRWYKNNMANVEGMTWFTVVDPYLGWQTPSTLWNNSGLVDSNGVSKQPGSYLWKHQCPPTGLSEANSDDVPLKVFPNPCTDILNIKGDWEEIEIQNVLGKTIYRSFDTRKFIDMCEIPSGIYFVRIRNEENEISGMKIIKQ